MNTNAIDKIIKELSLRDFKTAYTNYPESFKRYHSGISTRKPKHYIPFSYTLGIDTIDAIEIKKNYLKKAISENEYKAYCLRFNLLNI